MALQRTAVDNLRSRGWVVTINNWNNEDYHNAIELTRIADYAIIGKTKV